jgi:hypothetical protein
MEATETRPPTRATAWGGIAFAVLYVGGIMTMISNTPDTSNLDTHKEWTAVYVKYYADSGNRATALIGAWILIFACIAVVVFGAHLHDRLTTAGSFTSARLAFAGSVLLASITMVGALAFAWLPGGVEFGDAPAVRGELAYWASQLAFGPILVGGGIAAALTLIAAGIGSVRTGALPAWLAWAGIVIAVIVGVLGAYFVPMVLLALWVLIAGIVGLRRPFANEVATA